MIVLLGTTLTASFFDSLNPSAIVQQMVLQAMVKRKRQIWFFIFGIALANLLLGLAVYYGLAAWVWRWVEGLLQDHPSLSTGPAGLAGWPCSCLGSGSFGRPGKAAARGSPSRRARPRPRPSSPLCPCFSWGPASAW